MSQPALQSTVLAGPWPVARPTPSARIPERRQVAAHAASPADLRDGLTGPQLETLEALEIFRWRLAFVRRPLFQAPIPVLFDQDGTRHIVIREDGSLDEQPTLRLRH